MNRSLLPIVLTALGGGACGAMLTLAFSDRAAPQTASSAAPSLDADARSEFSGANDSRERDRVALAMLSDEVNKLAARVEQLERRPEPDARVELSAARALDPNTTAGQGETALAPQVVQESVAAALETIRADERAKADAERKQRELERIEERLTRLNERLALSPDQTNMMRALMLAQNTQRDELERMRGQGVEREQRRIAAEEAERRRDVELTRILTPEQLAGLREMEAGRGDERGRSRRGNAGANGNSGGGGRRGG